MAADFTDVGIGVVGGGAALPLCMLRMGIVRSV